MPATTREHELSRTSFGFRSSDGTDVAAYRWSPVGATRGILQITHGLGEHALRYGALAAELTAAGFAVVAQDHRGHGASSSPESYGQLGPVGWPGLIADIGMLSQRARNVDPDVPLVLLGHSMGSFAAQQYALDSSAEISALALTGTAALDIVEPAANFDEPFDLDVFNAPFAPSRTDFDYLSRDDEVVDSFIADPRCGFSLDGETTRQVYVGARGMADTARLARMRADLPVYIAVGEKDSVHGELALLSPLVERYRTQLTDVELHVYPGARHEVFNEVNREEVVAGFLAWLDRVAPAD